mmetsp:Transcript_1766/g.3346  ORF Transcript_1766/g.3346 Transcript_1766/m.3346 type:complete len:823 (-) Transcript_1766:552-3020(-)
MEAFSLLCIKAGLETRNPSQTNSISSATCSFRVLRNHGDSEFLATSGMSPLEGRFTPVFNFSSIGRKSFLGSRRFILNKARFCLESSVHLFVASAAVEPRPDQLDIEELLDLPEGLDVDSDFTDQSLVAPSKPFAEFDRSPSPPKREPRPRSSSPRRSASSNGSSGSSKGIKSVIHAPKVLIGDEEPVPPAVSDFRVSEDTSAALEKRGITHFTPIQFETFDLIYDGNDIVGKSRTGTGKTLAFALPIIEQLKQDVQVRVRGRPPRCLVLAPTRELANQVAREFEEVGKGAVDVICVYGGSSYIPQENAVRRGVDVVVATPGRLIDLVEKKVLNLSQIQHAVLDEADEMLRMGFEEDVEKIFHWLPEDRQTLMFSATVPAWARSISKRFLKNPVTVDTVGTSKLKTSETVKHMAMVSYPQARANILRDLITIYGKDRTIVFTMTKKDADDLAATMRDDAQVLHGDIAQYQRELTLAGFREGRFRILIATDVAARGLDIPSVDLVVQYQMPLDSETYIHRSGRTGRAGRAGSALVLYRHDEANALRQLEREIGAKFELVSVPTPSQVLEAAAAHAVTQIGGVSEEVLPFFQKVADELLAEEGPAAFARALATVAGVKEMKKRSLLTAIEGNTMVLIKSRAPLSFGAVKAIVGRVYPAAISRLGKIELCSEGAVFDMPSAQAEELVNIEHQERNLSFEIPTTVPRFTTEDSYRSSDRSRRPRGGGSGDRFGGDRRRSGGGGGGGRYGGESRGDRFSSRGSFESRDRRDRGDARRSRPERDDDYGPSFRRTRQDDGAYEPRRSARPSGRGRGGAGDDDIPSWVFS